MEISITRGLAELKTLEKRIYKAIQESVFVTMQIGEEAPRGYEKTEDFATRSQAAYQQVTDLVNRRDAIKAAITESNATTIVKIGQKELTVAAAIERKDKTLQYQKELLGRLKQNLLRVTQEIDMENKNVEIRLEKRLESDLGSKDRKSSVDEVEKITEQFLKRYKPNLVDPIKIRDVIEKLEKEIEELEVDFVLSESNTRNTISIPE